MCQYVEDVKDAVEHLMLGMFKEEKQIGVLAEELSKVQTYLKDLYRVQEFLRLNPDLDDEGIGTAAHWEAYFDVEPKELSIHKKIAAARQSIEDRRASLNALASALLQIAKRGISIVYGKGALDACVPGRQIGSQTLKDIIWAGRNQSMHYEEGVRNAHTIKCFETLAEKAPVFSNYQNEDMAYHVV